MEDLTKKMKTIELTRGEFALVDDIDYEFLSRFKWRCEVDSFGNKYAMTGNQRGVFRHIMHQLVMGAIPSKGLFVDHIDHNGLNNQRSNLRWVTQGANTQNAGPMSNNKCGVRGVCFVKNGNKYRWRAMIKANGKNHYLGLFNTKQEAGLAYNKAALVYYGPNAYQNPL